MLIGIFSKFEMDGGSEFRCVEIANAIHKYTDHDPVLLCEKNVKKRTSDKLYGGIRVELNSVKRPQLFYDLDCLLIINTDCKDFSKLDYWEGKTDRHNSVIDVSKIKKMVFLYNFIISPSINLSSIEKKCKDVRIITTNQRFFDEITDQDRYKEVRHLPRIILESPIEADTVTTKKTESETIRIGRHSKSMGFKFNSDTEKLIHRINKKYDIQWDFMGVPNDEANSLGKIENVIIRKEFSKSVKDYLADIDIFLFFPSWSRQEPWSRAVAEGMMSGCPIVTTGTDGGNRMQVVNGNNGFLCDTIDEFENRLSDLIENKKLRSSMRSNSIILSNFFSAKNIVSRLVTFIKQDIDIFQDVIEKKQEITMQQDVLEANIIVCNSLSEQRGFYEKYVKAQIDNSLHFGWTPEKIILVSNYDFEYKGVKSVVFDLDCNYCLTGSKTFAMEKLFEEGVINGLVWVHDLDAWQVSPLEIPDIKDLGMIRYIKRWNGGSLFVKPEAKDIISAIADSIRERKSPKEEPVIKSVLKLSSYGSRVTELNHTYNLGATGFEKRYILSNKPIQVVHMHPNRSTDVSRNMSGMNRLGVSTVDNRLAEIFYSYFDIEPQLNNRATINVEIKACCTRTSIGTLEEDVAFHTNRKYKFTKVPDVLRGKQFLKLPHKKSVSMKITVTKPGIFEMAFCEQNRKEISKMPGVWYEMEHIPISTNYSDARKLFVVRGYVPSGKEIEFKSEWRVNPIPIADEITTGNLTVFPQGNISENMG